MGMKANTTLLVLLFCVSNWSLVGGASAVAEVHINARTGDISAFSPAERHSTQHHVPITSHAAETFGSVLSYIKVNEHYIVFPGSDGAWQASPMIAHSLRKPTGSLQIKVQFKKQGLDFRILQSSVAHVAIRPSNSSSDVHAEEFATKPLQSMAVFVDLVDVMARIRTFSSGPHTIQLRLHSPIVKEPLVITLGETDPLRTASKKLPAMQLRDLWEGTLWAKFVERCDLVKGYEEMLENRLWWAELIVAIFSVAYCSAVYWLGPLDFTPWQQRSYQLTCVSSACFQVVFLAFKSELLGIRTATPFSLAFGAVYFVSFNLTNVLILCEYSQAPSDELTHEETPRRRANAGRTFNSIPSSAELRGMTRVVMVGYKPARCC